MLPMFSLFNRDKSSDYEVYAAPVSKPAPVHTPTELSNTLRANTKPSARATIEPETPIQMPVSVTWYGPGTTATIQGIAIYNAFIYANAGNSAKQAEVVDTDLTIEKPDYSGATNIPPNYAAWTPSMRGAFLGWLATGRTAPNIPEAFLIFFLLGIEKRLLIDGPKAHFPLNEKLSLLQEIKRLTDVYAEYGTFSKAAKRLTAVEWIAAHNPADTDVIPQDIDFLSIENQIFFPWFLAFFAVHKKNVSDGIILRWYQIVQHALKLPTIPEQEDFPLLFRTRFSREFPDGYAISTENSKPLVIRYKAVNPALGTLSYDYSGIPDVFSNAGNLARFRDIIEECIQNYRAYDGYVATPDANEIGALIRLPIDLRLKNPSIRRFGQFLNSTLAENPYAILEIRDLLSILGVKSQLNAQSAQDLGTLIEMLGFQYAPNPKLHNQSLGEYDKIVLTPSIKFPEPSHAFSIMVLILRLGAVIAQCDEHVSQPEIDVLKNMVLKRKVLSDEQRTSLLLWLHWCLNTPQRIEDIHEDFDGIPDALRDQISHVLISVACADGVVTDDERDRLLKVHRALKLPEAWIELEIGQFESRNKPAPQKQTHESSPSLFKPKQSEPEIPTTGLSISSALSQSLSNLCTIVPDTDIRPEFAGINAPKKTPKTTVLDSAHAQILRMVMEKTTFSRLEFFKRAIENDLMGDRVIKKLNDTAAMQGYPCVIIDGDTLIIDTKCAQMLYESLSS